MQKENSSLQYYLYSASNFLAALGGGTILGKGISILNIPSLQGGSIMAFFIGTILGLTLLQLVPEKSSKILSKWFSIAGGFSSLILLAIFENYSDRSMMFGDAAIIFFLLLSVRFGFWFYSRVLRACAAAGQKQQIAWVEFGYYSGMILGLVIWKLLNFNITIAAALLTDAFLQFLAGFLDLYANNKAKKQNQPLIQQNSPEINNFLQAKKNRKIFYWSLPCAVALITIGTQVTIFSLTHYVSDYISTYILATFYLGASVGSVIFKKLNIQLGENINHSISFTLTSGKKYKISCLSIGLIASFFVSATILDQYFWLQKNQNQLVFLLCIFCSAFFYEIFALAILDKIGWEDHLLNQKHMVIRTYALMGISAALSLWIIGLTTSSLFGLLFISAICMIFSIGIMHPTASWVPKLPRPF